jgi:hypothetical protein
MKRSFLLIDAIITFVLSILLLFFPGPVIEALGIPSADTAFYPSIFGAILLGVGIALVIEYRRKAGGVTGLGLGGAIAIDLCGGFALAGWLLFADLAIPVRGYIILWGLVILLVGICGIEVIVIRTQRDD